MRAIGSSPDLNAIGVPGRTFNQKVGWYTRFDDEPFTAGRETPFLECAITRRISVS